jgi:ABC-type nitrate/sulfonate/bicarbonate transport system permease component
MTDILVPPEVAVEDTDHVRVETTGRNALMGATAPIIRSIMRIALQIVAFTVAVIVCWWAFLAIFEISPLVGKTPADVWRYLATSPEAAANRASMAGDLGTTLLNAGLGYAAGLVFGVVVAAAFYAYSLAEETLMPVALVVRSVPLVAMTPVVALVFGRGVLAVTVLAGIVVFFPALVNVSDGLRSCSPASIDLVHAYGGGSLSVLRRVALPSAVPAIFASARISVPGALIGALLAEWLATGRGMGARLQTSVFEFGYDDLWAGVVVLTVVSLLIYAAVSAIESIVTTRMGSVYAP